MASVPPLVLPRTILGPSLVIRPYTSRVIAASTGDNITMTRIISLLKRPFAEPMCHPDQPEGGEGSQVIVPLVVVKKGLLWTTFEIPRRFTPRNDQTFSIAKLS